MKLSDVAKKIMEVDDDKYVSIGYGRYKLKGKEDDDNADVFTKTDSGQYVKSADQKSDDDKGGEEKPKGKGLGKGDFERDFDDGEPEDKPHGGDTGTDADFQGEPPEGSREPDDDEPEVDGPSPEDDDWNSESVMTAKLDGEEVGDIIEDEDHPNYKKALRYIMSFDPDDEKLYTGTGWKGHSGPKDKDESITINGKKYRPIKESKQHIFKEIYDRTFRSLK